MKIQTLFYFFVMGFSGWAVAQHAPYLKVVPVYDAKQDTIPPPLPKGLLATNATTRIEALRSLDGEGAIQETWAEKIIEMALLDPAISVRMEAEQTLHRNQALSEKENIILFQLSSSILQERRSALIALKASKKTPYPLKWSLQYALLKDMVFSHNSSGIQENFKSIDHIESETSINRLSNYFVEYHPLMQKILLKNLDHPDIQNRAKVILASIVLDPVIQWELLRIATALHTDYTNQREGAFYVISKVKSLRPEVERGLVEVAVYNSGNYDESITLREALVMDKKEVDPALLAYYILLMRPSLNKEAESDLAYWALLEKPNISSITQDRIKNILQKQIVLNPSTEKALIGRLLNSLATDKSLNTVYSILSDQNLDPFNQNILLQAMSSQMVSPKAKKVIKKIFLYNRYIKKEIIKKMGFLFRCQKVFAH